MCGIFGAINLDGFYNQDDFEQFASLTRLTSYRGPDAHGHKALDTHKNVDDNRNRFDIFLGHRRLSIIDLSIEGKQPMVDDNRLWITYNGEIFNYIELKEELRQKGHEFRTKTDTEVILKLYREYGEDGFKLLNGMWSFAIVDIPRKKVVLSRDRFSIKPLYYYKNDKQILFASEIKQLLPAIKNRQVNRPIMHAYIRQALIDFNEETFFSDIYKLKPMHNIVISLDSKNMTEKKYWDYSVEPIIGSKADIIEQFRQHFIDSVKIRLRSDVPVGCLLSGGLDSSSIAVISNNINPIQCFSVISDDKDCSEENFIDIVARDNRISTTKMSLSNIDVWNYTKDVIWHHDEPCGGFSVVAQNQILELIRKNSDIKVILSGQGGDETLCGYRKFFFFYLKDLLRQKQYGTALQTMFHGLMQRTVLQQFSLTDAKRYMGGLQNRNVDYITSVLTFQSELEPIWEFDNLRGRQRCDIDKYSVPALAHYEDRNSMAYSLELRLPFLDHRLVNFALNLSSDMKINRGWTKYILRRAITELPKDIAWRRDKKGFRIPAKKWIENDFKNDIIKIFSTSKLHDMGLIDKEQFLKAYNKFLNGYNLLSFRDISRFIMAEIWSRLFFENDQL